MYKCKSAYGFQFLFVDLIESNAQVKMDEAKKEWMKMVSEKESTTKETSINVIQ